MLRNKNTYLYIILYNMNSVIIDSVNSELLLINNTYGLKLPRKQVGLLAIPKWYTLFCHCH